jgi:hypothetical protein
VDAPKHVLVFRGEEVVCSNCEKPFWKQRIKSHERACGLKPKAVPRGRVKTGPLYPSREARLVVLPVKLKKDVNTVQSTNKKCKHSCFKKSCLEKQVQGQEACKNHKKVLVAVAAPTGGVAEPRQFCEQ